MTASSRQEPVADSATQRARRPALGGTSSLGCALRASFGVTGVAPACLKVASAAPAQSSAKTPYATDHETAGATGRELLQLTGFVVTGLPICCMDEKDAYRAHDYCPILRPASGADGGTASVCFETGALSPVSRASLTHRS